MRCSSYRKVTFYMPWTGGIASEECWKLIWNLRNCSVTQKQTPVTSSEALFSHNSRAQLLDQQLILRSSGCEPLEEVPLCQPSARHNFQDPFIALAWILLLSTEDADCRHTMSTWGFDQTSWFFVCFIKPKHTKIDWSKYHKKLLVSEQSEASRFVGF